VFLRRQQIRVTASALSRAMRQLEGGGTVCAAAGKPLRHGLNRASGAMLPAQCPDRWA
jgi:hypothetical protein